jgi:ubiquinone/menaquinone biosynthesis C-methylase UbiE
MLVGPGSRYTADMIEHQPEKDIRSYYDDFAARYEAERRTARPDGYHALIDDLEVDYALRYGRGQDVLEVGCGTGLILQRLAGECRTARGVDLSPGMLEKARERGLDVQVGSATKLPFEDATFDMVCSFKVLAHVPDIETALAEMVRVTRAGGHVLAEFYNPISIRAIVKRIGPAGAISDGRKEDAVYTRFDAPWQVRRLLPPGTEIVGSRGVRIVTPAAMLMRLPIARSMLRRLEWSLCDGPLSRFGGFWIAAIRKR